MSHEPESPFPLISDLPDTDALPIVGFTDGPFYDTPGRKRQTKTDHTLVRMPSAQAENWTDAERQMQESKERIEELTALLARREEYIKRQDNCIGALESELRRRMNEKENLEHVIAQQNYAGLQVENAQLQDQVKSLTERLFREESAYEEAVALRAKAEESENNTNTLFVQRSEELYRCNSEISILQQENASLRARLQELGDELESRVNTLSVQLADARAENVERLSIHKETVARNAELSRQLEIRSTAYEALATRLESLERINNGLHQEKDSLHRELLALQNRPANQERIEALEAHIKQKQQDHQHLCEELRIANATVDVLIQAIKVISTRK